MIGLGKIGAGFDAPDDALVRTHLKAIMREPRLSIAALSDLDPARAERERARFKIEAPVLAPDAALAADVDAVCVATPDGTHGPLAMQALRAGARVVVCEKPIEGDETSRAALAAQAHARGRAFVVNHSRRWIAPLETWAQAARAGDYGAPRSAVVHYNRGFRHNGTHALDILAACLAPAVVNARHLASPLVDLAQDDPTLSLAVTLRASGVELPLVMLAVDGRVQSAFSVDIRFDAARIVVEDIDGVRAALHRPAPTAYAGYAPELQVDASYVEEPPGLIGALWKNVADHLETGTPLRVAGDDALAVYRLADDIQRSLAR